MPDYIIKGDFMELFTDAIRFYREKRIPIWFNLNEKFEELNRTDERLRVVLVQRGTGILSIDERRLSIIAPAIICINEKENISMEDKVDWVAKAIYFHPMYINGKLTFDNIREKDEIDLITNRQDTFLFRPFMRKDKDYVGLLNVDSITMNRIAALFDCMRHEIEEQSHHTWSCCARSYFLELLFALIKVYEAPESKSDSSIQNSSDLVNNVVLYISSNYGKRITVSELCSMFSTNKTTLQKQFTRATGQSVIAYLMALRVKLATLMLSDTSITISQIAERLGFSDSTHFNRTFHKLTGYSPTQYRKEFRDSREKLPI